jgi:DNA-binding response OmpR family regulator
MSRSLQPQVDRRSSAGHAVFILTSDERFGRVVWKELSSTGRDVCVFARLEDAVAAALGRPPGVIIVDVVRQILSHELSIAGWEVLLARDGEKARRLIDLDTPDVVVTDAELPLRTGLWSVCAGNRGVDEFTLGLGFVSELLAMVLVVEAGLIASALCFIAAPRG